MRYWVYIHTCKANGKKYVGITTKIKPELRWAEGNGYQANKHFYSAIQKYGWTNFQHEVFEVDSKEEMYYAEKYLIAYYHTTESEFGYNHSSGGENGGLGCTRSEETRRKMSEANRKSHSDPEYRKKASEAHKKKWLDPEYREKVVKAMKEKYSDPEYKKKQFENLKKIHSDPEVRRKKSEAFKGRKLSEETRRKISETLTGRTLSEERRRKISETLKGRPGKPHSKEQRKKASESLKKKWSDPEYQKKMSEIRRGKSVSEERRRKISETLKGRPQPKIKIKLPDGTIREMSKQALSRYYINKGKKFEYVD